MTLSLEKAAGGAWIDPFGTELWRGIPAWVNSSGMISISRGNRCLLYTSAQSDPKKIRWKIQVFCVTYSESYWEKVAQGNFWETKEVRQSGLLYTYAQYYACLWTVLPAHCVFYLFRVLFLFCFSKPSQKALKYCCLCVCVNSEWPSGGGEECHHFLYAALLCWATPRGHVAR